MDDTPRPTSEDVVTSTSPIESVSADQPSGPASDGDVQRVPAARDDHWVVDAGRRYWHQSGLSDFLGCGLKYQYKYIDKIQSPSNANLIRGRLGHRAIEVLLGAKASQEEIPDDDFLAQIMADEMTTQWVDVKLSDDEKAEGEDTVRERALRHAWLGVAKFRRDLLPELNPVVVEQAFKIKTPYGFGLAGTIDLIEPDRITDWKFTGKSPAQSEADNSVQLSIYGIAYQAMYGADPPSSYRLAKIVVSPKREDVSIKILETTRGPEDFARALRLVAHAQRLVDMGAFHPAEPGSWRCSPQFCDYWDRCPFGANGRAHS